MGLIGAWRRQLLGASAAMLVVPGAIFLALAVVGVGGGGLGGIGTLRQLFTGPVIPAASLRVHSNPVVGPVHIPTAPVVLTTQPQRATFVPGRSSVSSRPAATAPAAQATPQRRTSVVSRPVTTKKATPPARRRPATGSSPSPPTGATKTTPGPVHKLVGAVTTPVKTLTAPLPVVGPIATSTIDSVIATVDRILPPQA